MRSAKSTTAQIKTLFFLLAFGCFSNSVFAQENSPYSRYGIGDIMPNKNILNRSMGGIATGYSDIYKDTSRSVSLNLANPASLGYLSRTVFDLGAEVDMRSIRSNTSPEKFNSVNSTISYLQIGIPLSTTKMRKNGNGIGLSFGLKPYSKINYNIGKRERLSGIDSLNTVYQGDGGLNQANLSLGFKFKNLNIGIGSGFAFGDRKFGTKLSFINDSLVYYMSNTEENSRFRGFFFNTGIQYNIPMKDGANLMIGGVVNLGQNLTATRNKISATYAYNSSGEISYIDTVAYKPDESGKLKLPTNYSIGFTYSKAHWLIGADFDAAQWADYRYFGTKDATQNTWTARFGAQYYGADRTTSYRNYWKLVKYRAGFYYGKDYVTLNTASRPEFAFTAGMGLPLTRVNYGENVVMNLGLEIGQRGNKNSVSVREGFTKISAGITMNADWFRRSKYY